MTVFPKLAYNTIGKIRNTSQKCCFSTAYTGKSYDEVQSIKAKHMFPTLNPIYKEPLLIHKGEMQYLWDSRGRKYLDLFGGIVTVSVGHCHPRVNAALKEQADKLWHTTAIYLTEQMQIYAQKLTDTLPDPLNVCLFVNSGSEANDLALMLAKLHTGNPEIVSMRNGYNGMTQAVMNTTNFGIWKHKNAAAGMSVHRIMNADPYKGIWGGAHCRDSVSQTLRSCDCTEADSCEAGLKYLSEMDDLLVFSVPKDGVAGLIIESIQGVGGTVQYPRNFMAGAFERIRSYGGLCISDEVQTGFGRVGSHYWGFETHGVVPDIVTMAKGMGNGFPMGAVVTTKEIADSLNKAFHFNTFGGNPLASVVGSTVLDVIRDEKLQENCANVGTYFIERLRALQDKYEIIGDVRGKGLMIGLEMVQNRESREPLPAKRMGDIFEETKHLGALFGKGGLNGNVLRIKPPMCITKANVDFAVDALEQSVRKFS